MLDIVYAALREVAVQQGRPTRRPGSDSGARHAVEHRDEDDELPGGVPMTETAVETAPEEKLPEALGTRRIADLMAERMDLPVTSDDVTRLVDDHQALESVDSYKGWPMYATADALALDVELVRRVVEERREWIGASLPRDAAAERIGWHWRDILRVGQEGRITVGRDDRYLISDLDRLAAG